MKYKRQRKKYKPSPKRYKEPVSDITRKKRILNIE